MGLWTLQRSNILFKILKYLFKIIKILPSPRYTTNSPLARKLFNIDGVKRVFYGKDYISIAKADDIEWNVNLI